MEKTFHAVKCDECGIVFEKYVEQMESLPTECDFCGSSSFEIFQSEVVVEEEYEQTELGSYGVSDIEQIEIDKGNWSG